LSNFFNILKTKFFIPTLKEDLTERVNLVNKINHGIKKKLTIVTSSAGFGKTTLLVQWAYNKKNIGWLSLSSHDNYLKFFLIYFISSISILEKELKENIITSINSSKEINTDYIITLIINNILEQNIDFTLIIDDYHHISNIDIINFISFFIENKPDNFHLILSGRSIPDIPLIARLRGENQLNEINTELLRFNSIQIKELLQRYRFNLSEDELKIINENTDGWIMGLKLTILSLEQNSQDESFIEKLKGLNKYISEYLFNEVLAKLEPDLRTFLLKTSLLSRFNNELCNYITGFDDSYRIIEKLQNRNLFIYNLDNEQKWFRYHHLFAEFLQEKFKLEKPEAFIETELKASEWLLKHEYISEAVFHALRIQKKEQIANIIEKVSHKLLSIQQYDLLTELFKNLDETYIVESPKIYVYYLWFLILNFRDQEFNKILKYSDILINKYDLNDDYKEFSLASQIALVCSSKELVKINFREAIKYAKKAIKKLRQDDDFVLGIAYLNLGTAKIYEEKYQESLNYISLSIPHNLKAANYSSISGAYLSKAFILQSQGNFILAENLYQECISIQGKHFLSSQSIILKNLAEIYYEWNNLEKAKEYYEKASKLSIQACHFNYVVMLNIYCSYLNCALTLQDLELAEKLIKKIELFLIKSMAIIPEIYLDAFSALQVRFFILKNNTDQIKNWLEKFEAGIENLNKKSINFFTESYIYSEYLIKTGKLEEALKISYIIYEHFKLTGQKYFLTKTIILQAVILNKKSEKQKALQKLRTALELAEPEKYIRVFVDIGISLISLFIKIYNEPQKGKHSFSKEFIKEILKANNINEYEFTEQESLEELFSEREREIIQQLNSGLSYDGIALELFVSKNTVKAHLKSIYKKLDVNTKEQALIKAKKKFLI
jgi:LuxR family maltose regulon positive regulatory protein